MFSEYVCKEYIYISCITQLFVMIMLLLLLISRP